MMNLEKIVPVKATTFFIKENESVAFTRIPYGLVVRILAFHAGGPGSIPGVGKISFAEIYLAYS